MKRLVLHIDRLVLDGLAPGERTAFVRGLHATFATALAERGANERWVNQSGAARIDAGVVRLPAGAGAFDTGSRAAQRIVGSASR